MTTENAEARIDYRKVAPQAIQALWTVERYPRLQARAAVAGVGEASRLDDQRLRVLRGHA